MNTTESHMDIGSRVMLVAKMGEIWCKGSGWLRDSVNWPSGIKTKAYTEIEKKA